MKSSKGNVGTQHSSGVAVESLISQEQGLKPTERPWRIEPLEWNSIYTGYQGRILFTKQGERKNTEHSLGYVILKDHFSHHDNPDFDPYTNLSDIDYKANAELIVRAVNAHDALVAIVQSTASLHHETHQAYYSTFALPEYLNAEGMVRFQHCASPICSEAVAALALATKPDTGASNAG